MTPRDIAQFFTICTEHPQRMTNMRVNKLVYYAQAWALVRLGRPLFDEEIEAWEHGPVIPSIYRAYAACQDKPLPEVTEFDFLETMEPDVQQLLIDVAREYDGVTTWQLRNMSHSKGEPWSHVYNPEQRHTIIPKPLITECFSAMSPLPLRTFEAAIKTLPVVDALPGDAE